MPSLVLSNNKSLCEQVKNSRYIAGSSLDVLIAVRDAIHSGAVLLTSPLCGNLRPYQQPFRSVLVELKNSAVDLESLELIEDAIGVYRDCVLMMPDAMDEATAADFAFIDFELLRDSLESFGQIDRGAKLKPAVMTLAHSSSRVI